MSISVLAPAAAVIAVDVGKTTAAVSVTDADRHRLFGPVDFPMTGPVWVGLSARPGLSPRTGWFGWG